MTKTIVKIDPKEYGIEETKAKEVQKAFEPMLQEMTILEKDYNKLMKKEQSPETAIEAHELRLKYVKIRTGTAEVHKKIKSFYLQAGKFIDGWKNAQIFASQGIEEKLMEIEKHEERLEEQRLAKLQTDRADELLAFVEYSGDMELSGMDEEVWGFYLQGKKDEHKAREQAAKQAEEDRLKREKEDEERREKIRLENIRLQKEAKEKDERFEKAQKAQKILDDKKKKEHQAELDQKEKDAEARIQKIQDDADKKEEARKIQAEKDRLANEKEQKRRQDLEDLRVKKALIVEKKREDDQKKLEEKNKATLEAMPMIVSIIKQSKEAPVQSCQSSIEEVYDHLRLHNLI